MVSSPVFHAIPQDTRGHRGGVASNKTLVGRAAVVIFIWDGGLKCFRQIPFRSDMVVGIKIRRLHLVPEPS